MHIALPHTPEIHDIARRVVWFEQPEQSLSDPVRFLSYAFRYAHYKDMQTLRTYVSDDGLRTALQKAPSGIIDPRSFAYWQVILDCHVPMRTRKISA